MTQLTCIYGTKVILRPITLEDTSYIVKWRNNVNVRKNFIFQEPFTEEMHIKWMQTKVASGEVVQYIIELADTHKAVGSVYYRDIDFKNKSAEYGIFIGEDEARGKGVGTETAQLFTEFGFCTLGLHRISLRVLDGNASAIRSYEKAGFAPEGTFKDMVMLRGEYRDVVFMARINPNT